MGSENLLRGVATLVGGGFIVYAAVAIVRGTFYDSDEGPLDRATQPLAFWLSVISMTLLGLFILGVGQRWEVVRMIFELAGRPF
jgi:spore maturation protein SpmA